jgi:CubicO group peptidase (beta-lactamase class C family)
MKRVIAALFVAVLVAAHPVAASAQIASDAEIRKILADRIDAQQQGVGIVVGVIEPSGRRIVAYGSADRDDKGPLNGDTVFEIGSVTKVFTSLLLADAVQRGEVALNDPVSKYLPKGTKVPEHGGKPITLVDLATHTSGLPSLPSNLRPKDPGNPYADYTVAQLYEFLASYPLPRDPGAAYDYSNLGAGLLGHALARRAGMDYDTLVRTRITGPLSMNSTSIALSDSMRQRLAKGHDVQRERTPNWDFPTLAGAGALRSTANDLLNFLAANLGQKPTPLSPAMASMLVTRRPTPNPRMKVALAWHIVSADDGRELVWHNGGTGGYRSFLAFDPKNHSGVVVLSNMSTNEGVDDIGLHLLDPSSPLLPPKKGRKKIAVDPAVLERYAGKYQLAPTFIITITREGNRLFEQATAQPRFEIFPETDHDFFLEAVDAEISFVTDSTGRVTKAILHQGGVDQDAKRIE